MKVAIVFDMEGVSHIGDHRETLPLFPAYWEVGRGKLMADVAAAAAGLLGAGVSSVPVVSHHGAGESPWPNVVEGALPDGAFEADWGTEELSGHVDAMLQVGCHSYGGSPSFMSHTFLPGIRLRIGDELLSESHGWAFSAGIPVLGIVGSAALEAERGPTLADVPFLAVQRGHGRDRAEPVFATPAETAAAIRAFAARVATEASSAPTPAPASPTLVASLHNGDAVADELAEAGWTRRRETEFEIEGRWPEIEDPMWTAVGFAYEPWAWVFPPLDWSRETADALDPDFLARADRAVARWVGGAFPTWFDPDGRDGLEGSPGLDAPST